MLLYCFALINRTIVGDLDGRPTSVLFDDMMISLRYARELVEGHGLVWNSGEYVEGFTNPLSTMMFAVVIACSSWSMAPLIIQGIGAVLLAASGLTIFGLVARLSKGAIVPATIVAMIFSAIALVLFYPALYWSMEGAEASLCLLLTVLAIATHVSWDDGALPSARALKLLGWLAALGWLVRPDAPIVIVPFFAVVAFDAVRAIGKSAISSVLVGAVPPVSVVLLSTMARWSYYDALLPNTYTLKMENFAPGQRLENGINFISLFMSENWLVIISTIAIAALVKLSWRRVVPLIMTIAVLMVYQIYAGGDPWTYWRMLVPIIAPIAYLAGAGILDVLRESKTSRIAVGRRIGLGVAVVALFLGLWMGGSRFRGQILLDEAPYTTADNQNNVRIAEALRQVLTPDASIGVIWAGTIPYIWNGRAIDMLGKADKYIANLAALDKPAWDGMKGPPGHNKYDFQHSIVELRPDYLQHTKWGYENSTDRPSVQAFIADHYARVIYHGVPLCLLKNSPRVHWDLLPEYETPCD